MRITRQLSLPVLTLLLAACGGDGSSNNALSITSSRTISVEENQTAVATVTATHADADDDSLSFSLSGGDDRALFAIDANSGALTFQSAPDYENPMDADSNNVYDLTVQVSDGSLTASQALAVTVSDATFGLGEGFWPAVVTIQSTLEQFPDDGAFTQGDQQGVGSSNELPLRSVTLEQSFEMSVTEISNQQYCDMLNWALTKGLLTASTTTVSNASGTAKELLDLDNHDCQIAYDGSIFSVKAVSGYNETSRATHPVVEVTWHGSQFFCWAQNKQAGIANGDQPISFEDGTSDWSVDTTKAGWRLPTEAEWEYAARGGWDGGAKYPWWSEGGTNDEPSAGDCNFDGYTTPDYPYTTPAGHPSFAANGFGLRDMAGNVWEWCSDWYDPDAYDNVGDAATDPVGPNNGAYRIVRGGSWADSYLRCADRGGNTPATSHQRLGFRPVRGQGVPTSSN